jgi:hypothetical protein|tara:strand:- start:304 stop:570 length:267 start_codon:yes stop_codon:yes gene_type:complete
MFDTIHIITSIVKGEFNITVDTPARYGVFNFALDDIDGMVNLIKPFTEDGWKLQLMTSSSIDFPEEYDAPEGFNARKVLDEVFDRMSI